MSSQNISTSSTSSGGFEAIEESVMASNASEKAEKVTRTIKMSTVSDIGGSREMQDSVGFNAKRVIVADGHGTYGKGTTLNTLEMSSSVSWKEAHLLPSNALC
jgi:hypothetical protein